jgi:hypothetical protein
MSKNEKEVRHKAERIVKRHAATINPSQKYIRDREVVRDLLTLLDEKDEVIGRLREAAKDAADAFESLPEDCIGSVENPSGIIRWYIRDELVHKLKTAAEAAREGGGE